MFRDLTMKFLLIDRRSFGSFSLFGLLSLLVLVSGCGQKEEANKVPAGPSELGKTMLLTAEPSEALNVGDVFKLEESQDTVVVVGRIGGSRNPWVDGLAAFTFTDLSLTACSEIPGDDCSTPWDFCCEPDLNTNTLLVQMVNQDGSLIDQDARQLLGVGELDTVVVEASVSKDDSGNVTLSASKLYIKKSS
tara:strand:- start:1249 stop:1821 length:573 start_codon:yes stop_codon:yes gene_type:complete